MCSKQKDSVFTDSKEEGSIVHKEDKKKVSLSRAH